MAGGKDKDDKKTAKLQTHAAPTPPIATSHRAPRQKGPANAPAKSCASAIKSQWRRNKHGMSLREFARKHAENEGSDWLRNKGVRDVGSKH